MDARGSYKPSLRPSIGVLKEVYTSFILNLRCGGREVASIMLPVHSPFNIAPMRLGAWHMCAEPKSQVVEMLYYPK